MRVCSSVQDSECVRRFFGNINKLKNLSTFTTLRGLSREGEWVISYISYMEMCCCEGYGFQSV